VSSYEIELKKQFLYKSALEKVLKIDKAIDRINARSMQKKAA
jgi:hypothetical protein